MDEPAENVVTPEVPSGRGVGFFCRRIVWCAKAKTAVRPVAVVVPDEGLQYPLDVASVGYEDMVETLAAHGADPALGSPRRDER